MNRAPLGYYHHAEGEEGGFQEGQAGGDAGAIGGRRAAGTSPIQALVIDTTDASIRRRGLAPSTASTLPHRMRVVQGSTSTPLAWPSRKVHNMVVGIGSRPDCLVFRVLSENCMCMVNRNKIG
jgi:hypothetical protein